MKGLSFLIRNAVLATAMVLLPSAASAWSGMSLVYGGNTITKGTVLATLTGDGGDYRFFITDALVYGEEGDGTTAGFYFVPQLINNDAYGEPEVENAYLTPVAAHTFDTYSYESSYRLSPYEEYPNDLASVNWFILYNYANATDSSTGYYVIRVYWDEDEEVFYVSVYHVDSVSDDDGDTTVIDSLDPTSTDSDEAIYIVGPAVGGSEEDSSTWDDVAFGTSNDKYSHELTLDTDGVYKYMVDGTEAAISMQKGSEFCFVRGSNWTGYVFQEDEVVPYNLSGDTGYKESDVYRNATSAGTYAETQYVNIMDVDTAGTGQSDYSSSNVSPMTFNLPSGSYYVRLYWGFDVTGNLAGSNSGVTRTYYTITPRTNTFTCPDANDIPGVDCNAFKAYCDYHAVVLPDTIDAYYVTYVSSTNSTSDSSSATARGAASMVKVDFSSYSDKVLPANTPVYLAISHDRGSATGLQTIASTEIEYYDHPWYTNDALTEGNLLVGAIERCTIPKTTSDGTTYYNYMLGYKKANSSDSKPTWGFYTPDAQSQCAINSVYLQTSVNIDSDLSTSSSSNYIALSFEGATTDDSETTAIDAIESVTGDGDDVYYTLQGFKLAAEPTLKGIYIHNGKKVIIK